ncbi:MAG: tryptophan--tRNA ligase [Myxococcota bacterium]
MAESGPPRGKRVLSGVQPTGVLHLGNYFGAMRQHLALQEHNTVLLFIADYHSLTAIPDPEARRAFSTSIALDYLALGLDPERAILYRQSDLPEVTELCWILGTVTPMGLLERAHSYKDKLAHGLSADLGLFSYPVLQAADILIHRSDLVPVGQDQKQHIEMTRDIAGKFNRTYGDVLTIPEPYILPRVAVVPGTDGRKMSKTYGNTIEMFAPARRLRKQIMGIVTDSTPVEDPKDPDASHLFALWTLFADEPERQQMTERFRKGGVGYGELKKDLVARVMDHFAVAREQRERLARSSDQVEEILRRGAERARAATSMLMAEVRRATGLGRA